MTNELVGRGCDLVCGIVLAFAWKDQGTLRERRSLDRDLICGPSEYEAGALPTQTWGSVVHLSGFSRLTVLLGWGRQGMHIEFW